MVGFSTFSSRMVQRANSVIPAPTQTFQPQPQLLPHPLGAWGRIVGTERNAALQKCQNSRGEIIIHDTLWFYRHETGAQKGEGIWQRPSTWSPSETRKGFLGTVCIQLRQEGEKARLQPGSLSKGRVLQLQKPRAKQQSGECEALGFLHQKGWPASLITTQSQAKRFFLEFIGSKIGSPPSTPQTYVEPHQPLLLLIVPDYQDWQEFERQFISTSPPSGPHSQTGMKQGRNILCIPAWSFTNPRTTSLGCVSRGRASPGVRALPTPDMFANVQAHSKVERILQQTLVYLLPNSTINIFLYLLIIYLHLSSLSFILFFSISK